MKRSRRAPGERVGEMSDSSERAARARVLRGSALLAIAVATLGLPVTGFVGFGLLVLAVLATLYGQISTSPARWIGAVLLALAGILIPHILPVPQIEEGFNAFVVKGPDEALERELPAPVFDFMMQRFTAQYPPRSWCNPEVHGCWRRGAVPKHAFAVSADAIYRQPEYSRTVSTVSLDHPTWWRAGFWNEIGYQWWGPASDLQRTEGRGTGLLDPGPRLAMPYFVLYEFPADLVGSQLCWRGDVLWETAESEYSMMPDAGCRALMSTDVGRRVFGVSIDPARPLSMRLEAEWRAWLATLAADLAPPIALAAILFVLVAGSPRPSVMPLALTATAVLVAAIVAPALFGGFLVHDGGDDGLTHEGYGRVVLARLLAGDLAGALRGNESVFYFMPGLRYARALERLLFGDTNLGYLAVVLALPALAWRLTRELLPAELSVPGAALFVATPLGVFMGSSFFQYVQQASRGYPDTLGYVLLLAGLGLLLPGRRAGGAGRSFAAGLLLALAIIVRPNLAPAGAVLLMIETYRALVERRWPGWAGLSAGLSLVLLLPLHNWVFGQQFVAMTAAGWHPANLQAPPSLYAAAAAELLRLDPGDAAHMLLRHIEIWLRGPAGLPVLVPLHVAGVAMLLHVAAARRFGRPLRTLAAVALAQHAVLLFWQSGGRHAYLAWLLTSIADLAWLWTFAVPASGRYVPALAERIAQSVTMRRYRAGCRRLAG